MTAPTQKELDRCPLLQFPVIAIYDLSQSQPDMAKGAIQYRRLNISGEEYTYFPLDDMLVRDDVLRWVTSERKKTDKQDDDLQIELL